MSHTEVLPNLEQEIAEIPALARARRLERGLSLRAAADEAGLGHTVWFRMEQETNSMSVGTLMAVVKWLNATALTND